MVVYKVEKAISLVMNNGSWAAIVKEVISMKTLHAIGVLIVVGVVGAWLACSYK